ncbi:hypothetical protein [Paenibacillus flagellatus]|uniref:hypothetical protein n=1 Tax=Paenibacillus flagellatus TaxID=2211139 RepID=UPI0013051AE3|nr:hypothetical protein [Paenibacillus flagellatus]
MSDNRNDRPGDNREEERASACETPEVAQVAAPSDLEDGIVELADKDTYIDEP